MDSPIRCLAWLILSLAAGVGAAVLKNTIVSDSDVSFFTLRADDFVDTDVQVVSVRAAAASVAVRAAPRFTLCCRAALDRVCREGRLRLSSAIHVAPCARRQQRIVGFGAGERTSRHQVGRRRHAGHGEAVDDANVREDGSAAGGVHDLPGSGCAPDVAVSERRGWCVLAPALLHTSLLLAAASRMDGALLLLLLLQATSLV
jgi:hypothetical protein